MYKLSSFIWLLVFGMLAYSSQAQTTDTNQPQRYSLADAQQYAIKNSYAVQSSMIDIEIARKKIWETTAIGLPQVSANVKYQNMLDVPTQLLPDFISPALIGVINQGVMPQLKANGLQVQNLPSPDGQVIAAQFGAQHNLSWGLTATQLVFSGEYLVGLQASRTFLEVSQRGVQRSEENIREQVAKSYYLVLVAKENVVILDSTVNNMKKIAADMAAMQKAGFVENTDVDQMRLTLANLENSLYMIQLQKQVAERLLKFQMGIPLESSIELTDELDNIVTQANIQSYGTMQFNPSQNIDIMTLETAEKLQKLSLKQQQSKYLPTLAAFYTYSKNSQNNDFNFLSDDATWYPTQIVGLQLDIPIFSSGMRWARVRQARLELEKTKINKTQATEGLTLEFEQSRTTFNQAQQKMVTAKENFDLAKRIHDKTLEKYKQGVSSSTDLTMAQNQYLSSQSAYYSAVVELLNAKAKLDRLLGAK